MLRVRLIHWGDEEGRDCQARLESLGYEVDFDTADGASVMRAVRAASPPDAFLIDLSRLPSHGREVGRALRMGKATRHIPLVFVDGDAAKVAQTRALLPDAAYATWGRVKTVLARAIARPPTMPVVPSDVMSARPTVEKLGVKPGFRVALLGSPKGFADTLVPLPAKVAFTARADCQSDLFFCFVRSVRELTAQAMLLREFVERQTLWFMWPKKASRVKSDLDGNVVRRTGLSFGWVDYKVCSIDATWSGLAFKRRR